MSIFLFSNSSKASEGFDIGADASIGFSDIYNNNLSWTEAYSLGCDIGVKCTKNLNLVSGILKKKTDIMTETYHFIKHTDAITSHRHCPFLVQNIYFELKAMTIE